MKNKRLTKPKKFKEKLQKLQNLIRNYSVSINEKTMNLEKQKGEITEMMQNIIEKEKELKKIKE